MRRRLVYICDWLPPDFGAVGHDSSIYARAHARDDGYDVALVGLSSTESSRVTEKIGRGTLTTVRIKTNEVQKTRWRRRFWWTLKINFRILYSVRRDLANCDAITLTGAPPFILHFIMPINFLLRRRITYRINDFYPERWMALLDRVPMSVRLLHWWTCFLRRRVDQFEVFEPEHMRQLQQGGIEMARIKYEGAAGPEAGFGSLFQTAISKSSTEAEQHPKLAERLAEFFVPSDLSDCQLGDLNQRFQKYVQKYGVRYTRVWYWYQVLTLLISALEPKLRKLIMWAGGCLVGFAALKGLIADFINRIGSG